MHVPFDCLAGLNARRVYGAVWRPFSIHIVYTKLYRHCVHTHRIRPLTSETRHGPSTYSEMLNNWGMDESQSESTPGSETPPQWHCCSDTATVTLPQWHCCPSVIRFKYEDAGRLSDVSTPPSVLQSVHTLLQVRQYLWVQWVWALKCIAEHAC